MPGAVMVWPSAALASVGGAPGPWGMVTVKVLPEPNTLSTDMLPPICSASCLVSESPRPVPSMEWSMLASRRSNLLKMRS
jgi:hypothetical protein